MVFGALVGSLASQKQTQPIKTKAVGFGCNTNCAYDAQCATGLKCWSQTGTCRNPGCYGNFYCNCSYQPSTPTPEQITPSPGATNTPAPLIIDCEQANYRCVDYQECSRLGWKTDDNKGCSEKYGTAFTCCIPPAATFAPTTTPTPTPITINTPTPSTTLVPTRTPTTTPIATLTPITTRTPTPTVTPTATLTPTATKTPPPTATPTTGSECASNCKTYSDNTCNVGKCGKCERRVSYTLCDGDNDGATTICDTKCFQSKTCDPTCISVPTATLTPAQTKFTPDFNNDGVVNLSDWSYALAHYQQTISRPEGSVVINALTLSQIILSLPH